jgi:hypothetical protein
MESIKLHINKLGLISYADLEITPMMVFSGESGLGKSYLAILCHYFFHVWLNEKRLDLFFRNHLKGKGIDFFDSNINVADQGKALKFSKTDLETWLANDAIAYLGYMLGHNDLKGSITVTLPDNIPSTIEYTYEREIIGLQNNEDLYWKLNVMHITYRFRQLGIQDESPYSYVLRHAIRKELFGDYNSLTMDFALPPSRGSFFTEELIPKTGLFKSFVEGMKSLEGAREIQENISQESKNLFFSLMEGNVQKIGDKYTYQTHGGTELPISAAASSIREMAPLQLLVSKRDISKVSLLIEEPEAHLHPLKQRLIADAIVSMSMAGANMQITTHSDNFLRRLNDLIRLNILRKRMDKDKYQSFCEKYQLIPTLTLKSDIISAYFLDRRNNGSVSVTQQDVSKGIPFDTFTKINGKPLNDSTMLWESIFDEE